MRSISVAITSPRTGHQNIIISSAIIFAVRRNRLHNLHRRSNLHTAHLNRTSSTALKMALSLKIAVHYLISPSNTT